MNEAFRQALANIGIIIVGTIEVEGVLIACVMGKANKRRASVPMPDDAGIPAAVASVKAQIASKTGTWPEGFVP